jgi:hypothetical protein
MLFYNPAAPGQTETGTQLLAGNAPSTSPGWLHGPHLPLQHTDLSTVLQTLSQTEQGGAPVLPTFSWSSLVQVETAGPLLGGIPSPALTNCGYHII